MIKVFFNKKRIIIASSTIIKTGDRFTCFQHGTNDIIIRTAKPKEVEWSKFKSSLTGKKSPYYKIHFVITLKQIKNG